MARVNWADLDQSDDGLLVLYRGKNFSGVAFETTPDGKMVSETEYDNGQRTGISREWSPAGVLMKEQSLAFDAARGRKRTWYESGALKSDGLYELGICLREQQWAPDGSLTRDFVMAEDHPQFKTLQLLRKGSLGQRVQKL